MELEFSAVLIERVARPVLGGTYSFTLHAQKRMFKRGLSTTKIEQVLSHGEAIYDRGSICFRVGNRTAEKVADHGIDLRDLIGLHVITSSDGHIITVYRNKTFRRPRKTFRHSKPTSSSN